MDSTIRNLDEDLYRELKARGARAGKTMGEMVNEAMRRYLATPEHAPKPGSLEELRPEDYPAGDERLSERVDAIVYGVARGDLDGDRDAAETEEGEGSGQ